MVLGYIGLRAYELYEAWRIGQMSVSYTVLPPPPPPFSLARPA